MKRLLLLPILGIVVLPASAQAAQVKISPNPSTVSQAGKATVEVANSSRSVLRGTAKVTARGRTVASRKVKLPKRSVTAVKLRFGSDAVSALREAGGRGTLKLRLRRPNGRTVIAKKKVGFQLPSGDQPAPGGPTPGGQPPQQPGSDRWVGRMGDEGAYDDLELTVSGGQIQITKTPLVPIYCLENGGTFRTGLSYEPFVVPGPWTIGTDSTVAQSGISLNQIVTGGSRSINYKVTNTAQQAGKVTGTLGMSYFDSQYDIWSNTITFVNCSGAQSFEAVPAG